MPYMWPRLLISYLSASVYVLLRLRSMQISRALGFVLSAWFANEQRIWLLKPSKDGGAENHQFQVFATTIATVAFFLACVYCAYVQTQIVIPDTYESSKTAAELLAEGYDLFSHPTNCKVFRNIVDNVVREENFCPLFDSCQSAQYLRHLAVGKVLQPVSGRLTFDDNFWCLEKNAVLTAAGSVSRMFGMVGKRL